MIPWRLLAWLNDHVHSSFKFLETFIERWRLSHNDHPPFHSSTNLFFSSYVQWNTQISPPYWVAPFQFEDNLPKKRKQVERLHGSVCWAPDSCFRLRSWSHGRGIKLRIGLYTERGTCLRFSLSFSLCLSLSLSPPLTLSPTGALSLSLSLPLKIKKIINLKT